MRRSSTLLAVALACAYRAPAQFILYDNGIGFINSDGIPEYQSFHRPRKKRPKKKLFPAKIGNVTIYEHGIGFINAQGTPEYQTVPGGVWSLLSQAFAVNEGHYSVNCPPLLVVMVAFGAPSKDPGSSAGILGTPGNLSARISSDPTGALVLHASDMRFDGMKGTATQTLAGTQFTFTDTRTVGNPAQSGTMVTISFTVPTPPKSLLTMTTATCSRSPTSAAPPSQSATMPTIRPYPRKTARERRYRLPMMRPKGQLH